MITGQGARFGVALTFFDPLPCVAGYGGTVYRNGLETPRMVAVCPPMSSQAWPSSLACHHEDAA